MLCLLAAFVAASLVGLLVHELRQDDLQAWMIARDAHSLGDLASRSRYEGHPILWYLVLWGLSQFTRDPLPMQLVALAISAVVAWIVLRYGPFPMIVRAALVFGYFPLFEYGVIPRGYGLGLAFLLGACAAAARRPRRLLVVATLLALASLTSVYALIVAGAIAVGIAVDEWFVRPRVEGTRVPGRALAGGAVVLGAASALAAYEVWPRSDGVMVSRVAAGEAGWGAPVLAQIWRAAVPIPEPNLHFWNSNLFAFGNAGALLSILLFCVVAAWVASRPGALCALAVGTAGLLAFSQLGYFGDMRHWGHYFVLAVAVAWLRASMSGWPANLAPRFDAITARARQPFAVVAAIVLAAQVIAAFTSIALDAKYPFSSSEKAAAVIREHGWAHEPIVGYTDLTTSAVGARLDRPMFFPGRGSFGTYSIADNRRRHRSQAEIIEDARRLRAPGGVTVVLLNERLAHVPPDAEFVAKFDSVVANETLYMYVVR
jgi:hypothetical protein